MKKTYIIQVAFASMLLTANTVKSQETLSITRIQGEFRFDGIVDDACWEDVQPLPMTMHTPVFGNQPTEKSEVMVAYDNTYIYVGARLYDSQAGEMLVTSKKRDENSASNESFTILFDSFNDNENALVFNTTPSGLRTDFTVFNDAISNNPRNNPFNESWNTFWDVKTTRNERGWFLEMRIPLSSLRFKEAGGQVTMGVSCTRRIAHKNEMDIFPAIPPDWGAFSYLRPSKAQKVVFEGISSKKPFYIAPFALAGIQQDYQLNEEGSAYEITNSPILSAGLDAKYGITNNLTLDVTVNTDFAQVEADDQQINLTRFSLFFPEKRTFFQERSSIFNFGFEGRSNLFYSRTIGLNRGEQVPILGGARITGMAGKWDIGFMDMQTSAFDPANESMSSLPSENFGVLRLRRQVINPNSYIGGIFTSRVGLDGSYNITYGVDGIFKLFRNDYFNIKLAQAMMTGNENRVLSADPTRIFLNWKRYSEKGLGYDFTYTRSGEDFDPGMGFQQRSDYSFYAGALQYGWLSGESSPLMNHKFALGAESYTLNPDQVLESSEVQLKYQFYFKTGFNGMVAVNNLYENVFEPFSLSPDAEIPAGEYRFNQFETHLHTSDSRVIKLNLDANVGGFYDGQLISAGIEPEWSIGSTLNLGIQYEYNRAVFAERDQSLTSNIARLKALLMITNKLSISSFIQYNDVDNGIVTNLRIRYNPREGNDFYIVLNEGRNTYRDLENPRLPSFNTRSLLLKYTYTFIL
jgi:hypothetical protein